MSASVSLGYHAVLWEDIAASFWSRTRDWRERAVFGLETIVKSRVMRMTGMKRECDVGSRSCLEPLYGVDLEGRENSDVSWEAQQKVASDDDENSHSNHRVGTSVRHTTLIGRHQLDIY